MVADVKSKASVTITDSMNASFGRVKTLRDRNDKLAVVEAHCTGNLDILKRLKVTSLFASNTHIIEALDAEIARYQEYVRSTRSLHDRLRSIVELVRTPNSLNTSFAN